MQKVLSYVCMQYSVHMICRLVHEIEFMSGHGTEWLFISLDTRGSKFSSYLHIFTE